MGHRGDIPVRPLLCATFNPECFIGIYLSRQGKLATWSLTELVDRLFVEEETPPMEDLRAQFKKAVLNQRAADRPLRNRIIPDTQDWT